MTDRSFLEDFPEADYFADPALSSSGARKLLPPSCPALFKWERDHPPESKPTFDIGHAAHKMVLEVGQPIVRLDYDDWRTKAAKEERDAAYAEGSIPLLGSDHDTVMAMAAAIREHPVAGVVFQPGRGIPEATSFWHDRTFDVDRKARIDWLFTNGRPLVIDYKSTASADPGTFSRSVANYGYFQQGAWYLDAAAAAGLDDAAFVLVAQEKAPPYLVSIFELDADSLRLGREKNEQALEVFGDCLANDEWPAYSDDVMLLGLPAWAYKVGL